MLCDTVFVDLLRLSTVHLFFVDLTRVIALVIGRHLQNCAKHLVKMAENKPKKRSYSLKEKVEIISAVDEAMKSGIKSPKSTVGTKYGLSSSTLSTFLKNRDKIMDAADGMDFSRDRKRMRTSPYADVEEMLYTWFKQKRTLGIPISGPLLQRQAESFAQLAGHQECKCSNGWLSRFKGRHDIIFEQINGEEQAVKEDDVIPWLELGLPEVLTDFDADDIYNADETGIFWRLLPDKTLTIRGEKCTGGKKSKERITALVAANMTGTDKLPLLIIGKFKNPRCFKNVSHIGVDYENH